MAPALAPSRSSLQPVTFAAMGTTAEVVVNGGSAALANQARARIEELERRWSRFLPASDVSRLNQAAGRSIDVSPDTVVLVEQALAAARATDGRFDPTVGAAVEAHGYDRDFSRARRAAASVVPMPIVDGSWPAIEVDADRCRVGLPEGVRFDPGAIGKGLAADLVTGELADRCDGILVNLGGDLRVRGDGGGGDGWVVAIEEPAAPGQELGRLSLTEGGVATTSRLKRRWTTRAGPAHHIFDPRTGRPADTEVVAVTVVAAEAWWAEVQATSIFLLGPDALNGLDDTVHALVVLADGRRSASPGLAGVIS